MNKQINIIVLDESIFKIDNYDIFERSREAVFGKKNKNEKKRGIL